MSGDTVECAETRQWMDFIGPMGDSEVAFLLSKSQDAGDLAGGVIYDVANFVAEHTRMRTLEQVAKLLCREVPLQEWGQQEISDWIQDNL
jgi:hypothetical protein